MSMNYFCDTSPKGIVLKVPTPKSQKITEKTPQKTSAVFHIGDSTVSDDETDTKLAESAAQMNLKSNGLSITCVTIKCSFNL